MPSCEEVRDGLLEKLRDIKLSCYGSGIQIPILICSGGVLYSSYHTVRENNIILMGLNPGGDSNEIKHTIIEDIYEVYEKSKNNEKWSSYFDEDWDNESNLAQNIKKFVEKIFGSQEQLRDLLCTNLVFVRSRDEGCINEELMDKCWPVHQWLFEIIRPALIIVYSSKAYNYLKNRLEIKNAEEKKIPSGRSNWNILVSDCSVNLKDNRFIKGKLIYIPHFSRYSINSLNKDELINFKNIIREVIKYDE